mmetsp:Transcript_21305/g.49458  ORF Transcript_21305/g.49458 Transcript_21305/m.49458 type:complete len:206 (-) Transcript_21305:895-1512(-)
MGLCFVRYLQDCLAHCRETRLSHAGSTNLRRAYEHHLLFLHRYCGHVLAPVQVRRQPQWHLVLESGPICLVLRGRDLAGFACLVDCRCDLLLWRHVHPIHMGNIARKAQLQRTRIPEEVEILVHQVSAEYLVVEFVLPGEECALQSGARRDLQWPWAIVHHDGHHVRIYGAGHHIHAISGATGQLFGDLHGIECHRDCFGAHTLC